MNNSHNASDAFQHGHTPEEIRDRLAGPREHSYLRDFVYGAIDGAVTTFAVVSGVAGAQLDSNIVIILGAANLIGDGFSMAAGNYLGTRAEQQVRDRTRQMEESHIDNFPEAEREEIRQIFAAKGFTGDDLERAVEVITSDRKRWVDTMLTDELGVSLHGPSPIKAAVATFVAFVLVGALPLIVFVINVIQPGTVPHAFVWSAAMTGIAFFVVGAMKSRFVAERWYTAGLKTLMIGGAAAIVAYFVGWALRDLVT